MGAAQQELHLHRQSCQSQLLISFLLNCGRLIARGII